MEQWIFSVRLESSFESSGCVNVQNFNPMIVIDLAYKDSFNVFESDFYHGFNKAYLIQEGAEKLATANSILMSIDSSLRIVVFDAARPRSVQRIMWNSVSGTQMEKYVAYPEGGGSLHNYGCAVDVGLIYSNGDLLDMGYGFDHLGWESEPRNHIELLELGILTQQQIENRNILRQVMRQAGFLAIDSEWWHFNVHPKEYVRSNYSIIE